jgi:NAD(P)-dependent dehydrogenase (short-subunit alcohol dehydrogenase family)
MADLDSSTAVITGAAQGIGQEIATQLAAEGAHVVVADVQDGQETVDLIESDGGSAEYRSADVTDSDSLASVFEGLAVDILVNNAAIFGSEGRNIRPFHEIPETEWDQVMDVNAKGVFLTCKAALPGLTEGARIVNVSSGMVIRGPSGWLPYVASKAAVIGMTRSLATELGDDGVHVNAVMPAMTLTDDLLADIDEASIEERTQSQMIEEGIEPHHIADAVRFLCTPDSALITGQVINVDGGRSYY